MLPRTRPCVSILLRSPFQQQAFLSGGGIEWSAHKNPTLKRIIKDLRLDFSQTVVPSKVTAGTPRSVLIEILNQTKPEDSHVSETIGVLKGEIHAILSRTTWFTAEKSICSLQHLIQPLSGVARNTEQFQKALELRSLAGSINHLIRSAEHVLADTSANSLRDVAHLAHVLQNLKDTKVPVDFSTNLGASWSTGKDPFRFGKGKMSKSTPNPTPPPPPMVDPALLKRRAALQKTSFEHYGIGGLDAEVSLIIKKALFSRSLDHQDRAALGIKHSKGILLHGPPGCGKTMIAKHIADILDAKAVQVVNASEVESKWMGETAKNIKDLFYPAELDWKKYGENSGLHVLLMDEVDAIAGKRCDSMGGYRGHVDQALMQLLCCMDGLGTTDNILVIGMTNRFEILDPAILRPGRLGVHIHVGMPTLRSREAIFRVHMANMQKSGRLSSDVDLQWLAFQTPGMSGADIQDVVQRVILNSCMETDPGQKVLITKKHFEAVFETIKNEEETKTANTHAYI